MYLVDSYKIIPKVQQFQRHINNNKLVYKPNNLQIINLLQKLCQSNYYNFMKTKT